MEILARVTAGHYRDFGGLEVEGVDATGLDEGYDSEWLDAAPKGDEPIRIAQPSHQPAIDVDLDDVAAVDTLLDSVPKLADEDRRNDPGSGRWPT